MSDSFDARAARRATSSESTRTGVSTPRADHLLREILAGLDEGSVDAVGDLFDLFGADVWRAALIGAREADLAAEATVDTFRAVWHRPTLMPDTTVAARRWMLTTAVELSRDLAAEGAQR